MSNGVLTKCPKGHEIFALEGHPMVDGLPVCPTCLFKMHLSLMHTSMQLNNKVVELLEELRKHKTGLPNQTSLPQLPKSAAAKFSQSSTSEEEAKLMEQQLATQQQVTQIKEATSDYKTLESAVKALLIKYLSPKTIHGGKGIVVLGLNISQNLIIDNATDFKIIVYHPMTNASTFAINSHKPQANTEVAGDIDIEAFCAKVQEHLKGLTDIEVSKLRALNAAN